jgi:hypothetical protein
MTVLRPPPAVTAAGPEEGALVGLARQSFEAIILEALLRGQEGAGAAQGGPGVAPLGGSVEEPRACSPSPDSPVASAGESGVPPDEGALIERESARTGVDSRLLVALRRAENGGPGREFGVRSVSASTREEQARVAANTIRNTALRYTRQGGEIFDPATGRYSEGFLRFLSARYAPVGAANDPTGLNQYHARNLIALYRQAHERRDPG